MAAEAEAVGAGVAAEDHEVVVAPAVAVRAQAVVHRGVAVRGRAEAARGMSLLGRHQCRGRALRMLEDRAVALAELQTIGRRWAPCRRQAIARARGPEIGQVRAILPIDRAQEIGPAQATLPIGRTWALAPVQVLARALVRGPSLEQDQELVDDRRHAMCKIFLICRMRVVGISAAAARQAALVMLQLPLVARWLAVLRRSF